MKPDEPAVCNPDTSVDLATALEVTPGTPSTEYFCPRGDHDFWHLATASANQVLKVGLAFQKTDNVRLALEAWGPTGVCVTSPSKSCGSGVACPSGSICDQARSLCRASAAPACTGDADCPGGTSCAVARDRLIATAALEPQTSATLHTLAVNLPARIAGNYYLSVFDHNGVESDPSTPYTLDVGLEPDPDEHEPNDGAHMASAVVVTPGVETELAGFLATADDEDWYEVSVSPALSDSAVVLVDLSWPVLPGVTSLEPTWTLVQGGVTYDAPAASVRGSGASSEGYRRTAIALASADGLLVAIRKTQGTFDDV